MGVTMKAGRCRATSTAVLLQQLQRVTGWPQRSPCSVSRRLQINVHRTSFGEDPHSYLGAPFPQPGGPLLLHLLHRAFENHRHGAGGDQNPANPGSSLGSSMNRQFDLVLVTSRPEPQRPHQHTRGTALTSPSGPLQLCDFRAHCRSRTSVGIYI